MPKTAHRLLPSVVTLALSAASAAASANCYLLYNAGGTLLSAGGTPPYSVAWPGPADPVRDASRARGEYLVVNPGECPASPAAGPRSALVRAAEGPDPARPVASRQGGFSVPQAPPVASTPGRVPSYASPNTAPLPAAAYPRASHRSSSGSSGGGSGLCATPSDRDIRGHRCGKRAASER